jgi:hypothetical protein
MVNSSSTYEMSNIYVVPTPKSFLRVLTYFPLSIALLYPQFLATTNPGNGLGSGLTRGLVRVYTFENALCTRSLLALSFRGKNRGKRH